MKQHIFNITAWFLHATSHCELLQVFPFINNVTSKRKQRWTSLT